MKVIDLSHMLQQNISIYPDDIPPEFKQNKTLKIDGYNETKLTLSSHSGTHIDAPLHIIKEGKGLNEFSMESFIGTAGIIDLSPNNLQYITLESIKKYEAFIRDINFLIINTGWSRFWGMEQYLKDYPVLTLEAAVWLSNFKLQGIGIDAISVDSSNSATYPIHQTFLNKEILIIENLTNLMDIGENIFNFYCLPLKYKNSDGSPIRAFGIIENK